MTRLYLDYAATTPIHPAVQKAMIKSLQHQFGNPSAKHYLEAEDAKESVDLARQQVARLFGVHPAEIIFTSGATEGNNFIIKGIAEARKQEGNHLITTTIEHPSVLEVFHYLETKGFEVTYLPVSNTGTVSASEVEKALRPETILVSIQWANNEIGSVFPIEQIAKICERHDVFLHSDATQAIGKLDVHLNNSEQQIPIDAISFSAHKFYGPKGVGAVYLKRDEYHTFPHIIPLLHGGGQEYELRGGTLAVPSIVALGVAADLAQTQLVHNRQQLVHLEQIVIETFETKFKGHITWNHPPCEQKIPGLLSLQIHGLNNEILVKKLAPLLSVSTGSACSSTLPSHVLQSIGLSLEEVRQTIRISLSPYLTENDLDLLKEL